MIKSFRSKALKAFFETGDARKLSVQNPARLRRILAQLDQAVRPGDMVQSGFRFHPLGEMAPGRYAVDASANWRITFAFQGQDAVEVDLEDYH